MATTWDLPICSSAGFHITNCNGYLPPGHRYQEGGYEVARSVFSPAAADILVERARKILQRLRLGIIWRRRSREEFAMLMML